MMRTQAVQITGRLSYRDQVLALWRADPTISLVEMKRKTGAPRAVVLKLRAELVAAGVMKAGGSKW